MDGTTSIRVSEPVWRELHGRKSPGQSFDEVLRDVLELEDELEVDA